MSKSLKNCKKTRINEFFIEIYFLFWFDGCHLIVYVLRIKKKKSLAEKVKNWKSYICPKYLVLHEKKLLNYIIQFMSQNKDVRLCIIKSTWFFLVLESFRIHRSTNFSYVRFFLINPPSTRTSYGCSAASSRKIHTFR